MIRSIVFQSLEEAVVHAKDHGGWIVKPADQDIAEWFPPEAYGNTPSNILSWTKQYGERTLGTWPMFDGTEQITPTVTLEFV